MFPQITIKLNEEMIELRIAESFFTRQRQYFGHIVEGNAR